MVSIKETLILYKWPLEHTYSNSGGSHEYVWKEVFDILKSQWEPFSTEKKSSAEKRGSQGLMVLALLPDLTPTGSGEGEEGNQGPRISDCWLKLFKYK